MGGEPGGEAREPGSGSGPTAVRVDAWLWAVRGFKTRSAATAACRAGHVRVNGKAAKPSQTVRRADEVRVRIAGFDRVLEVRELLVKRVGPQIAVRAFTDRSPARTPPPRIVERDRGAGRPTKRERRELERLRGRDPRDAG